MVVNKLSNSGITVENYIFLIATFLMIVAKICAICKVMPLNENC